MARTNLLFWSLWTVLVYQFSLASAADSKICSTDVCKRTGQIMRSAMDPKTDPCDDFYQFACGNFMAKTVIPHGQQIVGPFFDAHMNQLTDLKAILSKKSEQSTTAQDKAIMFYKSCIDSVSSLNERTSNMDLLKQLLTDLLNGWPLTTRNWNPRNFDLTTFFAKIASKLDQTFFLAPMIIPDMGNSSKYSLTLLPMNPAEQVMPFLDEFMKTPDQISRDPRTGIPTQQPQSNYQELPPLAGIIREVACIIDPDCANNPDLYDDVVDLHGVLTMFGSYNNRDLYAVDKMMLKMKSQYASNDPEVEDMRFTIAELNEALPQIDWSSYFRILFENTNVRIDDNFKVLALTEPLTQLLEGVDELDNRRIALFLGWHIVSKYGKVFSPQIRAILSPGEDQTDVCLSTVNRLMGYAVGNLYNQEHVSDSTKKEVSGMVTDLKVAFRNLIVDNPWMDSTTKTAALKKADNMGESVAEPDWINDEVKLNDFYSKLTAEDMKDFRKAFKSTSAFSFTKQSERLNRLVDRKNDWPIEMPAMTNAMYFLPSNFMYFGSGMLQYPFYEYGRPRAVNFGSIGYIAGHEITHGFDTSGSQRNEFGELRNWWTPASYNQFQTRAECFIGQYGAQIEPTTGMQVNGELTVGENIADNGGIRAAFQAYRNSNADGGRLYGLESYTEDQLFFMSAALTYCTKATPQIMQMLLMTDVHSPNPLRALLPMANSDAFSEAFKCPKGSPMNPSYKCRIW